MPDYALVIPHSSYGKGYIVPPLIWSWLRDEIIPQAQTNGIKVQVCPAYYSRGDDWGLVTNPTTPLNYEGFFISYGASGSGEKGFEPPMKINLSSITSCVDFTTFTIEKRLSTKI